MRKCPKCGNRFTLSERLCPHDGSVLEDAASTEQRMIGKTLAGKYRIDSFLKRGGMGAVYRATHLMLNKAVAIKLIKPELVTSEDTVRRFQREARAASHLTHPNIVTIHDLGQAEDGTLYIAMELVSGKSLKEVVTSQGPLAPGRAIRIAQAIASALELAHKASIIHRDLKPQNIMISKDPDGGEIPKLLDFGIAKTFEVDSPALTSTGMVLGTPQYMSPEQAGGKPVDARSDLYALGVILYEMLVGKVPFDDPSIPAILVKHMSEMPKPPSELRSGLPVALESVVLRCLEKDPQRRFQSAEEFSTALTELTPTLAAAECQPTVGLPALSQAPAGPTSAPPPKLPTVASVTTRAPDATIRAGKEKGRRKSRKGLALALGFVAVVVLVLGGILFFLVSGIGGLWEKLATPAGTRPSPPATEAAAGTVPSNSGEAPAATDRSPSSPSAAPSPVPPPSPEATEQPTPPTQPQTKSRTAPTEIRGPSLSPERESLPRNESAVPLPASPSVHASCRGIADACASFRSALQQTLEKAGIVWADPENADILLASFAEEVEARNETQFGTTFVIRTYSIEVTGEAPRFGEPVSMPPPEMVTFDTRFGSERLNERSRVLADTVTEKIRAYWSGKKN